MFKFKGYNYFMVRQKLISSENVLEYRGESFVSIPEPSKEKYIYSFNVKDTIIQKPVDWFTLQINWLVSI